MRLSYICFLFLPFLSLRGDSKKPPVPPGGIIERDIQKEYEIKEIDAQKQIPLLETEVPQREFDTGGATVFIRHVTFSGNTVVDSSLLEEAIQPILNKELGMKEIHEICSTVEQVYSKEGYFLSKAYVPPQEIENDTLKIEIIEGKLGTVSVVGNQYYSKKFIGQHFKKYRGKPLHYDQILKVLLLLNENSDLNVGAIFKKGTSYGTADLIVQVNDARPVHLSIDHNNYGSDHTSRYRTGATLKWGNLLMNGDMCTLIEVVGSPVDSLNFTETIYHFPINYYGSCVDLSFLYSNSKTDKLNELRYKGISRIATVKFTQAFQRTRSLNINLAASFDYKQIQNFGGRSETSYDKLRILTGDVDIDYIDNWKGRNLINASLKWGIPNILGGSAPVSSSDSRVNGGGRFVFLRGSWKRLQKAPYGSFMILSGIFQYSFDKLPISEQIYIGGVTTVRGYKLATGIGDSGFYANVELRVPPPFLRQSRVPFSKKTWGQCVQFVGFLDHGQVSSVGRNILRELGVNKMGNPSDEQSYPKQTFLTSSGCGLRIYGPWGFEWSLDIGFPLTHSYPSSMVYFRVEWKIF